MTKRNRRIAWDRVIVAVLGVLCWATWQANNTLDAQYKVDLETTYRGLR